MSASRFAALSATLAVTVAALVPVPASALDKAEAAAVWSARNRAFLAVIQDPATNSSNVMSAHKAACRGLLGEHLRIGGITPHWATGAQHDFCRAIDGFSGVTSVKNPCGDLKSAGGKYGKAVPFGDSEAVTETSLQMVELIETIRRAARQSGFRKC